QRAVSQWRTKLEDCLGVRTADHLFARRAELVNRKQLAGRPGSREADAIVVQRCRRTGTGLGAEILPTNSRGWRRIDEAAASDAAASAVALDQASGFEKIVGRRDRGSVQAKQASQFTSGWQPLAVWQAAILDGIADLLE